MSHRTLSAALVLVALVLVAPSAHASPFTNSHTTPKLMEGGAARP